MYTTPPSLLERVRSSSDEKAWERFIALYTPFIFSLARKAGLGRDEAADVVQDVFLLLTRKMVDFDYKAHLSFRAWLRTVVVNRLRENARRRNAPTVIASDQLDLADANEVESIDEAEYRKHLLARALKIMQRDFSPTTWKACGEHVVSGRPAAEVGAELGISEGAVYVA